MEVVPTPDSRTEFRHLLGGELDDTTAPPADHVVVRILAEGMLVMSLLHVKPNLLEDAAFDEKGQCTVHGRFADLGTSLVEKVEHLFRLEVIVEIEYGLEDSLTGAGPLDGPTLEELAKRTAQLVGVLYVL